MASESPPPSIARFQPLASCVDVSFWHTLSQKKLEEFKLSTESVPIVGTFGPAPPVVKSSASVPARISLGPNAFKPEELLQGGEYPFWGQLFNANTVEEFKAFNKKRMIDDEGKALWKDIESGACTEDPSRLNRFLLISYANLKTHRYYYWFAFPALNPTKVLTVEKPMQPLSGRFSPEVIGQIFKQHARKADSHFVVEVPSEKSTRAREGAVKLLDLKAFSRMPPSARKGPSSPIYLFAFADPATLKEYPGWPLRNYLMYLRYCFPDLDVIEVLSIRDRCIDIAADSKSTKSTVLSVRLRDGPGKSAAAAATAAAGGATNDGVFTTTGWEPNAKGRLGARLVDLKSVFDPKTLARTSADLNLKLMRWRSLPSLDTEMLKRTSCLLLGSGTLGCNVARTLIGWGVRRISFVDNGKVSYSNPVRQPLFTYEDSVGGKTPKAKAAAENLMKVCPSAEAEGHVLTIPMPGHSVSKSQAPKVKAEFEKLRELIIKHDIIFLLTDSRESRWLPSLIASAHNKLLINAALGFDTFVVMRHGTRREEEKRREGRRLGCYFCNDVVAPTDSLSDRTLDQQCTVTRPGLAPIASALSAEMAISLLHNTSVGEAGGGGEGELGAMPHQIRGSLRQFSLLSITGNAYDKCTACSDVVVEWYRKKDWDFVVDALNKPAHLEEVTGLAKMKKEAEDFDVDIEWDDEDDDA